MRIFEAIGRLNKQVINRSGLIGRKVRLWEPVSVGFKRIMNDARTAVTGRRLRFLCTYLVM
eukprot:scaffold825_cov196-Alexandrium_tamarense.AAC.13